MSFVRIPASVAVARLAAAAVGGGWIRAVDSSPPIRYSEPVWTTSSKPRSRCHPTDYRPDRHRLGHRASVPATRFTRLNDVEWVTGFTRSGRTNARTWNGRFRRRSLPRGRVPVRLDRLRPAPSGGTPHALRAHGPHPGSIRPAQPRHRPDRPGRLRRHGVGLPRNVKPYWIQTVFRLTNSLIPASESSRP